MARATFILLMKAAHQVSGAAGEVLDPVGRASSLWGRKQQESKQLEKGFR